MVCLLKEYISFPINTFLLDFMELHSEWMRSPWVDTSSQQRRKTALSCTTSCFPGHPRRGCWGGGGVQHQAYTPEGSCHKEARQPGGKWYKRQLWQRPRKNGQSRLPRKCPFIEGKCFREWSEDPATLAVGRPTSRTHQQTGPLAQAWPESVAHRPDTPTIWPLREKNHNPSQCSAIGPPLRNEGMLCSLTENYLLPEKARVLRVGAIAA